jgi:hypothetical protein
MKWREKQLPDAFIAELEVRLLSEGDQTHGDRTTAEWLRWAKDRSAGLTIDVIWTTGATAQRRHYEGWGDVVEYDEELVVTPGAMRMDRLNAGAPFLDSHRS